MTRVLFVCLGNICRSPLAEGAFRHHVESSGLADRFEIDSAGTAGYHAGEKPDSRSAAVARKNGIDINGQRARRVIRRDFDDFDEILAMDRSNLRDLERMAGAGAHARIGLLLEEAPQLEVLEVPDPYYGGRDGFDHVWQLVDTATAALLRRITR